MDNNYMQSTTEAKLGWNWGAFMMPIQFGVGNRAYMCLLALVPFLSFIWLFVSGAKGAEWAYNSGEFSTIEEFNASMRTWNRAGFVSFVAMAIFAIAYVLFFGAMFSAALSLVN